MIYDCFMFYNELDILEIRLEELYPVVDRFIIVEGSRTFQGAPKPQLGWENSERYEKYSDKISWCLVNTWPNTGSPWEREFHQRNMIKHFLERDDMKYDDTVIISDADEIPRREVVKTYSGLPDVTTLRLDAFFYGLNVKADYQHNVRMVRWDYLNRTTPQEVRTGASDIYINNAGWHFSYLGDIDFIMNKLKSYSHVEFSSLDRGDIEQAVKDHRAFWMRDEFSVVDIDHTWPHAVVEDLDRWSEYIWR